MSSYVLDIETDGLLSDLSKVHCVVLRDVDSKELFSYGPNQIHEGLDRISKATKVIAHNGINFDIPALQKVYPSFSIPKERVLDTLTTSRLAYPDLVDRDLRLVQTGRLESKYRGSHSLKAWGFRLGILKGDFGQDTDWSEWSKEMQDYCEQDTDVTLSLYEHLAKVDVSPKAVELEHDVAWIVSEQTRHGFLFDRNKAHDLLRRLSVKRAELDHKLQDVFDPWFSAVEVKTPTKTLNYKSVERHSTWAGVPFTVIKQNVFNPNSRHHIADRLKALYGWKPKDFTEKGQPKIDETVLGKLNYPEAKILSEAMMLQKRISQLGEGDNSWLGMVTTDNRVHGEVNTNGAVTGRMTHNKPNLAQVPAVGKPFGKECRELFCVPKGKKLVGVDVSGLELRMLAHFLAKYDGGAYGKALLEGDIHTVNQQAAGLPTRNQAKTFISMG